MVVLLKEKMYNLDQNLEIWGLPWWLSGKESACNAGDLGLIPGLGTSTGEGNGNLLQYYCWRIMDRGAWWATIHRVTKSRTCLSN